MNNITFCILACAKNQKYLKRLHDYLDYGFKHTNKEIKIKFVFLIEDEIKPDFIPEEYIWYNCPNIPLSCRLLKYIKEESNDSEWIMQVDDDSSTDLDKTYELLKQFYNHDDSIILMGGRNTDLERRQQNIIKNMGVENFFFETDDVSKFDTHPYFVHAWEPTILSNKAINVFKQWSRLDEYFDLCLKNRPIFTDQTPYVVAKLAKIPIVECSFMSPFNKHTEFSAINTTGRYSHIHYITENWPGYNEFKKKMINAKKGFFVEKQPDQEKDLWNFYGGPKGKEKFYGVMCLNEDGTIGQYYNDNEFLWEKEEDSIVFLNTSKKRTCVLKKINEDEYCGNFLSNPSISHLIKRLKNPIK